MVFLLRGQQLLYYNDGSAPGIIRVVHSWFLDGLSDGPKWRNLITKPAVGVTRVLTSYWDDWWNHANKNLPDKPAAYTWLKRFEDGDCRGVLDYAAQVRTKWCMCPYREILPLNMNRLGSIG